VVGPVVVGDRLGGVTVDGAGGDWGPGPPGGVGGGGGFGGSGIVGPAGVFGGWRCWWGESVDNTPEELLLRRGIELVACLIGGGDGQVLTDAMSSWKVAPMLHECLRSGRW
jgi:hypothetical protein